MRSSPSVKVSVLKSVSVPSDEIIPGHVTFVNNESEAGPEPKQFNLQTLLVRINESYAGKFFIKITGCTITN